MPKVTVFDWVPMYSSQKHTFMLVYSKLNRCVAFGVVIIRERQQQINATKTGPSKRGVQTVPLPLAVTKKQTQQKNPTKKNSAYRARPIFVKVSKSRWYELSNPSTKYKKHVLGNTVLARGFSFILSLRFDPFCQKKKYPHFYLKAFSNMLRLLLLLRVGDTFFSKHTFS